MELQFSGEPWFWRGRAPWYFLTVPDEDCGELATASARGPGETAWKTSLFPKDGRYIVPAKAWVRKAEGLELGDVVTVRLAVDA